MRRIAPWLVLAHLCAVLGACGGGGGGDGGGGAPSRFACGNTVTSNTTLVSTDNVTQVTCPANGLTVAPGVSLNLGNQTLRGSGAGTGVAAGVGSTVSGGTVRSFATGVSAPDGTVTLLNLVLTLNTGPGLTVGVTNGSTSPSVSFSGAASSVSGNDGAGIVIYPSATLTLTGTSAASPFEILDNGGSGLDVRGQLTADYLDVGSNDGHGVLVETDAPVVIRYSDVHDNGQNGILALRTDPDAGFVLEGGVDANYIRGNTGHGVALGDAADQSGPVYGFIGDAQIYGNNRGISVVQRDAVAQPTTSTILFNNIYNNVDSGVYLSTSSQRFVDLTLTQGFIGNSVHHNAITGACTVASGALQTASQIVVSGPISGTDPVVGAEGPDLATYPKDHACFWGNPAGVSPITAPQCTELSDPEGTMSGGVSNHCIWTGTQCRLAWDLGPEESSICNGPTQNRIFAYVNDPNKSELMQRGIAAFNGAFVRARQNIWGVGGANSGTAEDAGSDARIDPNNDCGSVSTCP